MRSHWQTDRHIRRCPLCHAVERRFRHRKYTHRYANKQSVNGVLDWLKASCGVDIQNINPSGLNLLNGVLTLQWQGRTPSYSLKKHSPDIIYTYVSKVKYDPDADPTYCDRLLSVLEPAQQKILLKVVAASIDLASVRAKADNRSIKCLLLKGDGILDTASAIWLNFTSRLLLVASMALAFDSTSNLVSVNHLLFSSTIASTRDNPLLVSSIRASERV
jgi:D5 N terminal like